MFEVPTTRDPAQKFVTELGGNKLQFDLQWNDRSNLFTLTLTNEDTGFVYFQGSPLVLGADLLGPYNYGIGSLILAGSANDGQEANLDNIGVTVLLYWFAESEKADAIEQAV